MINFLFIKVIGLGLRCLFGLKVRVKFFLHLTFILQFAALCVYLQYKIFYKTINNIRILTNDLLPEL